MINILRWAFSQNTLFVTGADPTIDDPLLLQSNSVDLSIDSVNFKYDCMRAGCWMVSFRVRPAPGQTLYLPRSETYDYKKNPFNFPCDPHGTTPTECCLLDFAAQYHIISSFTTPTACGSDTNASSPWYTSTNIFGRFAGTDMPLSQVVPTFLNNSASGLLMLDWQELRENAASFTGNLGLVEVVDTFIGLARFTPTNSKFIGSAVEQIALSLTKSDTLISASWGILSTTVFKFANVNLYEVLQTNVPNISSQYASISFAINPAYSPKSTNDSVNDGPVPPASIRIRINNGPWIQVCKASHQGPYNTRINQQPCSPGPKLKVCSSSTTPTADGYFVLDIPLHAEDSPRPDGDYTPLTLSQADSLAIEFNIHVLDTNGRPIIDKLSTSIAIDSDPFNRFCVAHTATTQISDAIQSLHLLTGIATNDSEMQIIHNTRTSLNDGSTNSLKESPTLNAKSIPSALITLVLQGTQAIKNNPNFRFFLEDLYSIHIMGSSMFQKVKAALSTALTVQFNSLQPYLTLNLDGLCSSAQTTPISNPLQPESICVSRHDVIRRSIGSNVFEVPPTPSATAAPSPSSFLQSLLGSSDYSTNVAQTFASLLSSRYGVDSRSTRVFWVNPVS